MSYTKHICVTLFLALIFYNIKWDNQPSIVIIGAGASGIAAATKLMKNGFTNIKIIEAENRIGGRIYSVKFGDAYVDVGAEYCHGEESNVVYSLAKDLDVLRHTEMNFKPVSSDGQSVSQAVLDDLLKFFHQLLGDDSLDKHVQEECPKERSLGKCMNKVFNSSVVSKYQNENDIKSALAGLRVLKYYTSIMLGTMDLDDVARYGPEWESCPGDYRLIWGGLGYKTVLEILMQKYPAGQTSLPIDDKFMLNKEVISISNWDKDEIEIKCQDGTILNADHVIFTPSLGVLKTNYFTLFNPKLPTEKVEAIKNIGFGTVAKVIMHFPERWWNEDTTWILFWTAEDINKLSDDYIKGIKNGKPWLTHLTSLAQAKKNPQVLIAWYSYDVFPEIEELSDEEIIESHNYILKRFLGNKYNVSAIDKILRSNWFTNTHFLGTYSYPSVKGFATSANSKLPDKLAHPLLNNNGKLSVQFAGEATSPMHHSSVHGAIESGFREAERIINFYKK